jgi:hypothetical protein
MLADRNEHGRARAEVERALAQVEASELEVDVRAARALVSLNSLNSLIMPRIEG